VLNRFRAALVVLAALCVGGGVAVADPGDIVKMAGAVPCEKRTLVLSAFPAEADAVLAHTTLDPNPVVVLGYRHFYLGSIAGKKVVVAMTGIGLVNATKTTRVALQRFTCGSSVAVGAVVFSGVAGGAGRTRIGDVAVPARWTLDNGVTFRPVDPGMLAAAQTLSVSLSGVNNLGNPICLCRHVPAIRLSDLGRQPQLFVGGDGSSGDNNNGQALPCIPNGGDVFGCQPCSAPDRSILYTGNFFQALGPFITRGLLSNLNINTAQNPAFDAVDDETAAAQAVADAHGIPFLGIRGMSDGPGDPLHLPGFPISFFFYKQLAADNAARVTKAFLQNWVGP
jgi:nucleoside phosphorylase